MSNRTLRAFHAEMSGSLRIKASREPGAFLPLSWGDSSTHGDRDNQGAVLTSLNYIRKSNGTIGIEIAI
jgi:hypothetical protein